jgi:hypothetical protein
MTETCFHEVTVWPLVSVVLGASIEAGGITKNMVVDHTTPYEPQFGTEAAHAGAEMVKKETNAMCLKLLDKYKRDLKDPLTCKRY